MNEQSEIASLKRQLEEAQHDTARLKENQETLRKMFNDVAKERDGYKMQQAEAMRLFNLVCQERDQAQRACAEKDEALQGALVLKWDQEKETLDEAIKKHKSAVLHALSSTCGQDFIRASDVETVLQAFRQFVSTKRPLHNGPHGQVVYRLDFTGHAEGMVEDAFATLLNNAKGK